jgi:hypothetical protein
VDFGFKGCGPVVRGLCRTSWIIHNLDCCLFPLVSVVTYLHDTHSNML